MPRRTSTHQPGRRLPPGRRLSAVLIAMGLVAVTSCTQNPEPEPVSNPVKLLQNVQVGLSPAAGIESIQGTTISVSASGDSSAEDIRYTPEEVVDDLPIRVSLQYRAGNKSGSDLTELQGHTGPIEIDLTVENLTVKPQVIDYDAAGEARSDTALVGAPLTIAASTELAGTRVDNIVPSSADGSAGTNGVLSRTDDGAAVVQWATILAPPSSGASTTLRLVADVRDFQVPEFTLAVQPGLNTDLSAEGLVAGAFASGTSSEMELQLRTISLISDVNTVLTKAGSTITEVQRNLEETSTTLGVKTAGELSRNSEALAGTMLDLKEQLNVLGSDLETATKGTESVTMSSLRQTVTAVDAMLGDTSALPAPAPIDGEGCLAEVAKPQQTATVYSSILSMASQLDAYAKVSADCRDAVAGALQATMGPETPTAEECSAEAEAGLSSMTCSLYGSALTITGALVGLVIEGEDLVAELQPKLIEGAIKDQQAAADTLTRLQADLVLILAGAESPEDYTTALARVDTALEDAGTSLKAARQAAKEARDSVNGLRQKLMGIEQTAQAARDEVGEGSFLDGSISQQNQRLADELCRMADGDFPRRGRLSARDAEQLRSYLTASPCGPVEDSPSEDEVPGDAEPTAAPTTAPAQARVDVENQPANLNPPFGFKAPLEDRLADQTLAWDRVLAAVDTTAPDQEIGQAFAALDTTLDTVETNLGTIAEAVKVLDGAAAGNATSTRRALEDLSVILQEAVESSVQVGTALTGVKEQQDTLGTKIKESLTDVSAQTAARVFQAVEEQVRQVSEIGDAGSESVVTAFNRSISGLNTTSGQVVDDAKGTVNKQRGELNAQGSELAAALAESTELSLASIESSTAGSTRDVEGASALLSSSLNKVMLDLGDRSVNGSGLLGSMATSAAKADTADYQLALATQNAEGYANIRSQDVAGLLLRQAQFKASLAAVDNLPPFQLKVPDGATSQTLYTLKIGSGA